VLVLGWCLNNVAQSHYFTQTAEQLQPAIMEDYQRVFGAPPEGNWLAPAKTQARLAAIQLSGTELSHWHLLRHLNPTIRGCKTCQVDEITFNNNSALLTLKKEGSETLIKQLNSDSSLVVEATEAPSTLSSSVSLKLSLAEA